MKINEKELYNLYMEWVDEVSEEFEMKTHFTPEEIVGVIVRILESNNQLIEQ